MDWWLITFINSFVLAAYLVMNSHYKIAGNVLVFGRSGIVMLAMLPFMWMLDWPSHPLFYLFSIGVGISSALADMIMFNRIAQYGSAVVSRLVPLKIWIVFIFWILISPSTFLELWTDTLRFFAVFSMLTLGGISLMSLNRCPVSREVLAAVLLPIIMLSCSDVMIKGAMNFHGAGGLAPSFQFVFVISVVMTFISAVNLHQQGESLKQDVVIARISLLGGVLFFVLVALLALAYRDTPNPSYVVAIMSLNVVWIYLYHRFRNIPDKSNMVAGLIFVLSTVGLVLLTK